MKLTEQERIELKFITRLLWQLFGVALIVCSWLFGWMLSSFEFKNLERLIPLQCFCYGMN